MVVEQGTQRLGSKHGGPGDRASTRSERRSQARQSRQHDQARRPRPTRHAPLIGRDAWTQSRLGGVRPLGRIGSRGPGAFQVGKKGRARRAASSITRGRSTQGIASSQVSSSQGEGRPPRGLSGLDLNRVKQAAEGAKAEGTASPIDRATHPTRTWTGPLASSGTHHANRTTNREIKNTPFGRIRARADSIDLVVCFGFLSKCLEKVGASETGLDGVGPARPKEGHFDTLDPHLVDRITANQSRVSRPAPNHRIGLSFARVLTLPYGTDRRAHMPHMHNPQHSTKAMASGRVLLSLLLALALAGFSAVVEGFGLPRGSRWLQRLPGGQTR